VIKGARNVWKIALAFALTSSGVVTGVIRVGASPKSTDFEYLFVQKQAFSGLHKIYWTPTAIKIVCETQGYSLVMHGPDYKIYAYRTDDKVYRTSTLAEFFRRYPYDPRKADSAKVGALKLETIKKDGLEIVRYRKEEGPGNMLDLYVAESPAVAPQVSDLLCAYYRMGPTRGVVYRNHRENAPHLRTRPGVESWQNSVISGETSNKDLVLTTEVKRVKFNPTDFECPKGFKVVGGEDIYTSRAQKKQAESVLDDLNLGGKMGSDEKAKH